MRFRLFGFPIEIHFSFFLIAALLGWRPGIRPLELVLWIAVVVVSVIAHELGHAFTAARIGSGIRISLYAMGGLTAWNPDPVRSTPGRRAFVAAAGPAVGIVVGLALLGLNRAGWLRIESATGEQLANFVLFVNLVWALINLLPIRPLDGGHIVQSLLEAVAPQQAARISNILFLITAVGAVVTALVFRLGFAALLAGLFAWEELKRLRSWTREPAQPMVRGEEPFDDAPAHDRAGYGDGAEHQEHHSGLDEDRIEGVGTGENQTGHGAGEEDHPDRLGGFDLGDKGDTEGRT